MDTETELSTYERYSNIIPVFMLSAENIRILKNSEHKYHIKDIVETLISINEDIVQKIVYKDNKSIMYSLTIYNEDISEIIINNLQNLGYTVNIAHTGITTFDHITYSLIILI